MWGGRLRPPFSTFNVVPQPSGRLPLDKLREGLGHIAPLPSAGCHREVRHTPSLQK